MIIKNKKAIDDLIGTILWAVFFLIVVFALSILIKRFIG